MKILEMESLGNASHNHANVHNKVLEVSKKFDAFSLGKENLPLEIVRLLFRFIILQHFEQNPGSEIITLSPKGTKYRSLYHTRMSEPRGTYQNPTSYVETALWEMGQSHSEHITNIWGQKWACQLLRSVLRLEYRLHVTRDFFRILKLTAAMNLETWKLKWRKFKDITNAVRSGEMPLNFFNPWQLPRLILESTRQLKVKVLSDQEMYIRRPNIFLQEAGCKTSTQILIEGVRT